MKIRPTQQSDIPDLQMVLESTQLFPSEMLQDMLAGYLSGDESHALWLTCETNNKAIGFCYAVPETLTDGAWNMLAIAVLPAQQGAGCGAAITRHLEAELIKRNARILIADTSGTEDFAQTRAFYRQNGYTEEARIRDFWAPGDDKVTFWKSLVSEGTSEAESSTQDHHHG